MKIQERAVLHNRFDVKVVDAENGIIKQTAVGFNVITKLSTAGLTGSPLSKRQIYFGILLLLTGTTPCRYGYSSFLAFNTQSHDNVGNSL